MEVNFNNGQRLKNTELGKRLKQHGFIGSEYTLASEEEQPHFSKEFEEALQKYVKGYWEGIDKDEFY